MEVRKTNRKNSKIWRRQHDLSPRWFIVFPAVQHEKTWVHRTRRLENVDLSTMQLLEYRYYSINGGKERGFRDHVPVFLTYYHRFHYDFYTGALYQTKSSSLPPTPLPFENALLQQMAGGAAAANEISTEMDCSLISNRYYTERLNQV